MVSCVRIINRVLYELIVSRRRIPEEFVGVSNMYWVGKILDVRLLGLNFFSRRISDVTFPCAI